MGHTWHKACFTCGVLGKDTGCNRTMNRENYQDHDGAPYCNSCYGRLYKPKGFGYGNTLNTEEASVNVAVPSEVTFDSSQKVRRSSGGSAGLAALLSNKSGGGYSGVTMSPSSPPPAIPPTMAAPAPPTPPMTTAPPAQAPWKVNTHPAASPVAPVAGIAEKAVHHPKCPTCEKNVYKMEEIVAMSRTWHKTCFVCGANRRDGCGKTLTRDGFLEHVNAPYCLACHGKLHGAQNVQNLTASVAALSTAVPTAATVRRNSKKTDIHPSELFAGDGDEVDDAEW